MFFFIISRRRHHHISQSVPVGLPVDPNLWDLDIVFLRNEFNILLQRDDTLEAGLTKDGELIVVVVVVIDNILESAVDVLGIHEEL